MLARYLGRQVSNQEVVTGEVSNGQWPWFYENLGFTWRSGGRGTRRNDTRPIDRQTTLQAEPGPPCSRLFQDLITAIPVEARPGARAAKHVAFVWNVRIAPTRRPPAR